MQMNVSLSPKMYELVQSRVKSGMYSNASEVVRDALRRLDEEQRREDSWSHLGALLADAEKSGRSGLSVGDIVKDVISKKNQ